jgi:hypothetical protein
MEKTVKCRLKLPFSKLVYQNNFSQSNNAVTTWLQLLWHVLLIAIPFFTTVTSLLTPQNPSATACGPGFEPSNHPAQLSVSQFGSSTSALVRSNLLTPIQYVSQSALLRRAATAVTSRCCDSWCAVRPTQIVTQAACHVRAGVEIPAWRGSVYARPVT